MVLERGKPPGPSLQIRVGLWAQLLLPRMRQDSVEWGGFRTPIRQCKAEISLWPGLTQKGRGNRATFLGSMGEMRLWER